MICLCNKRKKNADTPIILSLFFFPNSMQSFIGKMKFGVSKILPNSLSKWLSPKVDANSARRRRHDEIDSDDEQARQNSSPLASVSNEMYQTTPELPAPPPNKRKKIFTVSTTCLINTNRLE